MIIKKIELENYRGVSEPQCITMAEFTTIVGKNDSGKSIVLNSIASFLDIKSYPIVESDFNDIKKPIKFKFYFYSYDLKNVLLEFLDKKIKKDAGIDEFVNDILIDGCLIVVKEISKAGKKFDKEKLVIRTFVENDFKLLHEKSDKELIDIIKKYDIEIPVEGKGKNSKVEKIKYIKEYAEKSGYGLEYIEINDEYGVLSLLPSVELFEADYGLKPDTSFKTQVVSEIYNFFDQNQDLEKIQKEIIDEMNNEAEKIKDYMQEYVEIEEVKLEPNISWKDAIKSVNVGFKFEEDKRVIPMSHKGTGYRRLFMVARFRYLAEKQKGQNVIYLIEEPETFLHPTLQNDLLSALLELSKANQIIITTHSPTFVGATNIDAVVLSVREKSSSKYISSMEIDENKKRDFILDIAEELGVRPYHNLRDSYEKLLFVESKNDIEFFNIVCEKLFGKGLKNNEKILALPFGGGEGNIDFMINVEFFLNSGRSVYVIIDSDKHIGKHNKQLEKMNKLKKKANINTYILKKSCIENYYHPRAFERVYELSEGTFDFFAEDENVKESIKKIVEDKNLKDRNIKYKNNIKVYEETKKKEWEEVLEKELIEFLRQLF